MSLHIKDVDVIQFADDMTLIYGHRNLIYLKHGIEKELESLQDWFYANKLTLNVEKSIYLMFGKSTVSRDLCLNVCNKEILRCNSAKFLGTWIDENLNWNVHVKKLLSKLKTGLGMLRRAKSHLNLRAKRTRPDPQ